MAVEDKRQSHTVVLRVPFTGLAFCRHCPEGVKATVGKSAGALVCISGSFTATLAEKKSLT